MRVRDTKRDSREIANELREKKLLFYGKLKLMSQEVERFVFLNPPGILEIVLISLLVIIVLYSAIKSTRLLTTLKRVTLISLHLMSFSLIVFILLNPALRVENYREEKPTLALVVDHSWSMNLGGDEEGISRIQSVRNFFKKYETFFSEIEKHFFVSYYAFDESLRPVSSDFINISIPNGQNTNINKVIKELGEKHNLGEIDSVILFSDGADNNRVLEDNEELSKNIGFPINTVALSLDEKVRDVWIDSVKASQVAFLRYPLSVDVVVKSFGFKGLSIPITLKEGDKLLSIEEISIASTSGEGKATFELQPTSVGRKIYTAAIPVVSGDVVGENNEKSFVVDVIINKIRVLHIAGSPSWDVKFLRRALKRNPSVDLVSFFILREATDLVFASQNELSLIPFPVDEIFGEELGTFDVVIFQNFDFRPYGIYGYHLGKLRDYVVQEEGSFLMIGGDKSFDSGNYERTPVSEILPVELDYTSETVERSLNEKEFYAELTKVGAHHPIMQIIPNEKENKDNWNNMPPLDGINNVEGLKPNAIPLLSTPEGEPILVLNQAKSGKVASFLSDSSWHWSFVRGGEGEVSPYYDKLWNRLLLWLIGDPDLKELRVKTDKSSYNLGEKSKVDIRILNRDDANQEIKSSVTLPSGKQVELNLEKISADETTSGIPIEEYGIYEINVATQETPQIQTDSNKDETVFLVEPPENEIRGPTTDADLLKTIAQKTGGSFITAKDNPGKLGIDFSPKRTITGYTTVQIWDKPWFFILLVALFSSEWILRRRWGLK